MTIAAVIAANRFELGARPGELGTISVHPRGWLASQIKGSRQAPDDVRSLPTSADVFAAFAQGHEERHEARALRRSISASRRSVSRCTNARAWQSRAASAAQGVTLLLVSPELQQR